MRTIITLLRFLRPFIREVCLSIFLGIATVSAGVGMLGTSAFLIASAALHPSIADLQVAIVGVRFFGISRAAFRYLERLVSHSVNLHVLSRIREWFYNRLESSPPREINTYKAGDLFNRVMGDLETLENFYVRVVSPVIVAVVVGAGVSLFLGIYNAWLGMILAIGLIINGFIIPIISIVATRRIGVKIVESRAELSARTVEWVQGLEELQSYTGENHWRNGIQQTGSEVGKLQNRFSFLNGVSSGIMLFINNLTVLGLLIMAIPLVSKGDISGVSMAVILLMGMASFESTGSLPQAALQLNASLESANRMFITGNHEPVNGTEIIQAGAMNPREIRLDKVGFYYDSDDTFKLKDVSFTLGAGKRLALIGPSGSGKTSLVNLLLRFWPGQKGDIYIDGFDINSFDPVQVRSCFAVVSQSTHIFSSSLRDNLLLADPQADDARLLKVLYDAQLQDWFFSLPQGLDTWLGDQGMRLSGGERQRVAIARALLQNRPFIILDEMAEHIDAASSRKINNLINEQFKEQGILIITHDITLLQDMDEIILLEEGSIQERGTYPYLIRANGRFAQMVRLQENSLEN